MRNKLPKDEFFKKLDRIGLAVTYNDVRLRTGYSKVTPNEVSLESKFSRNVLLKIPIVSSAMDTVTEYAMAIELAKLGGLGIIHKNLNPEEQSHQVAKVKYHLNGLIRKPIFVYEDEKINDVLRMREEKGYSFHSFPVLNREGKLVGILTQNDFDFCDELNSLAKKIMTKDLITAPSGTNIDKAYELMKKQKKKVLPLVNKANNLVGLYLFSDIKRMESNTSTFNIDKNGQLRVGAAIGVYKDAFERLERLVEHNIDVVVVDTAHGDSKGVLETIKEIKRKYPSIDVVAGNISEPESAKNLIKAGADGIKVGQGPGSICSTRIIAGVGCPQVTAVYNCAKVADKYGVPVCADGGLTYSGDIPIAIGAGAYSVMMGSMLAGTKESPGEIIFLEGRQWKSYRGMGSLGAMQANKGSRERYSQADSSKDKLVPEGVEGLVPYKGELKNLLNQYLGGLRSGMGYVGAANIEELRKKANFRDMSGAGQQESHAHGVSNIKEAPNYKRRD